jgi:hypothetical protein
MVKIDAKIPEGPIAQKWENYKANQKLVTQHRVVSMLLRTIRMTVTLSTVCFMIQ